MTTTDTKHIKPTITYPTLLITETMEDQEFFKQYITRRNLKREYVIYNGITHRAIIGDDIKERILNRSRLTSKIFMKNYLKTKTDDEMFLIRKKKREYYHTKKEEATEQKQKDDEIKAIEKIKVDLENEEKEKTRIEQLIADEINKKPSRQWKKSVIKEMEKIKSKFDGLNAIINDLIQRIEHEI
jgi:hypothetical protein